MSQDDHSAGSFVLPPADGRALPAPPSIPRSRAQMTTALRRLTPSFLYSEATWLRTVWGDSFNSSLISESRAPRQINATMSRSRLVRSPSFTDEAAGPDSCRKL